MKPHESNSTWSNFKFWIYKSNPIQFFSRWGSGKQAAVRRRGDLWPTATWTSWGIFWTGSRTSRTLWTVSRTSRTLWTVSRTYRSSGQGQEPLATCGLYQGPIRQVLGTCGPYQGPQGLLDRIKNAWTFWTGSRTLGPSGQDQERLGTSGQDLLGSECSRSVRFFEL